MSNRDTTFTRRGAILTSENISYLKNVSFRNKGYDFGEQKCDFDTQKTAEEAISSSLIQFMYVLILPLIMLFVNSIMSS